MAEDIRVNIETWAYGEVQRLKAEVARLRERAERAERERDLALLEAGKRFRCGDMRLRTEAEFIAEGRIAAGLDAAPAGEVARLRERAERERDLALLGLGRVLSGADAVKPPAGELVAYARKFVGLDAAPAGEESPP